MPSSLSDADCGLHVAIIMDGNGRWATARGRPRSDGHTEGAAAVRRTVEEARRLGVRTLTLYAFSSDNWRRPATEVLTLMGLFERFLRSEVPRCVANGIRLLVIGRRDRLPLPLRQAIALAERATASGRAMDLRVAVDYSARDSIVRAAERAGERGSLTQARFSRLIAAVTHAPGAAPDVDLLIRTGGELRLSDFLLWECAYAELIFTDRMWPDFDANDLVAALDEFRGRQRRFGGLPAPGLDPAV
jgi:undecaprenyl diphosphate synthase